jgi:plasmid maintenance system antidote protein VapI
MRIFYAMSHLAKKTGSRQADAREADPLMPESFRAFIHGLVAKHGSASAVAAQIGMSVSAFQRGVQNNGSLSVGACLRLAKLSGESPARVLRLAKKGDIVDLIEELFGPERDPLSDAERNRVKRWRKKGTEAEAILDTLLDQLPDVSDSSTSTIRRRA